MITKTSIATHKFEGYYYNIYSPKRRNLIKQKDREDIYKIQSMIWKTIREHYINNEAGLYLQNIGHLCHIVHPKIKFTHATVNRNALGGRKYFHICLDGFPKDRYCQIVFNKSLKGDIREAMVDNGKRYKFLFDEIEAHKKNLKRWRLKQPRKVKLQTNIAI